MTLSKNANVDRPIDQTSRELPAAAAVHIYRDALVGRDPAGMAKPFVPGDEFIGLAAAECDNTSGAAAAKFVTVIVQSDVVYTLTSAADKDAGKAVYATADDAIALTGHPDAFVGRILHKHVDAANSVVIRMKRPGEKPLPSDEGSVAVVLNLGSTVTPTGIAGADADVHTNGVILNSSLGLGVRNAADGTIDMAFDAVAEIANGCIRTPQLFLASKGVTFEGLLHMSDIGAAALDAVWGLVDAVTANSRLNMDHADAVSLALFHMDGASANILAESDDNVTDVSPVDTTIDNVTTAGAYKEFKVIARPSGAVEFWIDRVRVLSSTVFAVATTAVLAAVINMEKTSDATTAVLRCKKFRAAGARA